MISKKIKFLFTFSLAVIATLIFTSCGSDDTGTNTVYTGTVPEPEKPSAEWIEITDGVFFICDGTIGIYGDRTGLTAVDGHSRCDGEI